MVGTVQKWDFLEPFEKFIFHLANERRYAEKRISKWRAGEMKEKWPSTYIIVKYRLNWTLIGLSVDLTSERETFMAVRNTGFA